MTWLALALYLVYGALTFGVRIVLQMRARARAGSTASVAGPALAECWFAGVGFTLALAVGFAAPLFALLDVVEPIGALDTTVAHIAGTVARR